MFDTSLLFICSNALSTNLVELISFDAFPANLIMVSMIWSFLSVISLLSAKILNRLRQTLRLKMAMLVAAFLLLQLSST